MASVIESLKLISTDNAFLSKMSIFSLIPFCLINLFFSKNTNNFELLDFLLLSCLLCVLYGLLLQILNNSIKERTELLPDYNLFKAFYVGLKGVFSSSLFLFVSYIICTNVYKLLDMSLLPAKIIFGIVCLFCLSFVISSIIFYSKDFRFLGGLNLKKIFLNFHEAIPFLFITILTGLIVNIIISLPVCYMSYYLFHYGKILNYIISFIVTINLFGFFQTLSHLYFEQFKD